MRHTLKTLSLCLALPALASPALCADFPADKVASISAEVDNGAIRLAGRDAGPVSVSIEKMKDPSACRVTTEIQDKVLVLKIKAVKKAMGMFGTSKCRGDLVVSAPKALPVDASSGNGGIEATTLSGRLSLTTGNGGIKLADVSGELKVRSGNGGVTGKAPSKDVDVEAGNGGVRLEGLLGSIRVHVGNGGVDLSWAAVPAKGEAAVKGGMGGVTLEFPEGAALRTELHTGMGKVSNDFGESKDAGFKVSVESGMGGITIRKAK